MDKLSERQNRAERLKIARVRAGYQTVRLAADAFGWKMETYKSHETGHNGFENDAGRNYAKAFSVDLAWLMLGEEPNEIPIGKTVPIMGYIGAGSEIDPTVEQIPPEGFNQVEIPFSMPNAMIGFEVSGDSMLPYYDAGDVVVCFRDQRRNASSYIGKEVAVRTADDKRYLKRLRKGHKRGTYNLESSNARTIEDVQLEWIGEIVAIVKAEIVHKVGEKK